MLSLTRASAAVFIAALLGCCGASPVLDAPREPARASTCEYKTTPSAALAYRSFVRLSAHAPKLAQCRDLCTENTYCGNVAFRPPQNSSDHNCMFYQQYYYEPYATRPAPASHVVLEVKPKSCKKGPATPKPLKCKPGTVKLKGNGCSYRVTCGSVIAPHLDPKNYLSETAGPFPSLEDCFKLGPLRKKRPFGASGLDGSLSYSEGGSCIIVENAHYHPQPTEAHEPGLVYQIIKNSCNAKAATPKGPHEDAEDGAGQVFKHLAGEVN